MLCLGLKNNFALSVYIDGKHADSVDYNLYKSKLSMINVVMYAEGRTLLYKQIGLIRAYSFVSNLTSIIVTRNKILPT
jgi:hypothetical protein